MEKVKSYASTVYQYLVQRWPKGPPKYDIKYRVSIDAESPGKKALLTAAARRILQEKRCLLAIGRRRKKYYMYFKRGVEPPPPPTYEEVESTVRELVHPPTWRKITVRVERQMKLDLIKYAKRQNTSVSEVVRLAIEGVIKKYRLGGT